MTNDEIFGAALEAARQRADQALLLARIFASMVTLACLAVGQIGALYVRSSGALLAEFGIGEMPLLAEVVFRFQPAIQAGLLALAAVTLFFVWSRGRSAAWMAGIGLLVLIFAPFVTFWAAFLPLLRIMTEMGNM